MDMCYHVSMRFQLHEYLKDKEIPLLHADVWPWNDDYAINMGVSEKNIVNVAIGHALCNKTIVIYTIAGFTLYKAFEQLKFCPDLDGSIAIVNAGCHNEYPSSLGIGHTCPDYIEICRLLNITLYDNFKSDLDFIHVFEQTYKNKGVKLYAIGKDYAPKR